MFYNIRRTTVCLNEGNWEGFYGADVLMKKLTNENCLVLFCIALPLCRHIDTRLHAILQVYHSHFTPFEFVIPQDPSSAQCYAKVAIMFQF